MEVVQKPWETRRLIRRRGTKEDKPRCSLLLSKYDVIFQPINEHSLKEDNNMSPGKNEDEDEEESILRSEELTGSTHSLNSGFKLMQKTNSMSSLKLGRSSPRNDTPQSIPLADLDNELKISDLSLVSAKSLQSIKSYHGSIKVHLR